MKLQLKYAIALLCTMSCALSANKLQELKNEDDANEFAGVTFRKGGIPYYANLEVGNLKTNLLTTVVGATMQGGLNVQGPIAVNGAPGGIGATGPAGPAGAAGAAQDRR